MPRLLLAALALALVLLVGAPLAFDATRSDRIADGVTVAGAPVGGLDRQEATGVVRREVRGPALRDVVVEGPGRTFTLEADRAGVRVDVDASVQAALRRSREGNPWSRTWRALTGGGVEADVPAALAFDEAAVGAFVKEVGDDLDNRPRDADVDPNGGRLTVIEDEPGFRTDRDALLAAVEGALRDPDAPRELEAPGEVLQPGTTVAGLREGIPVYLIVDREATRLRVYEDLELAATYRIGVGRAGHETPSGSYDIANKAKDPTWHVPDADWAGELRGQTIPPGDPRNPLASRWLGIEDGIGIHGTDEEGSIGSEASHGCIRMTVSDVEELYERVPVGTPVFID
jgi:hypothetical protein